MKFSRKLLAVFAFVLSGVSFIRLLKFMLIVPSPTSTQAASFGHARSTPNSAPKYPNISDHTALTNKEFQFLSGMIASRVPCNLLVFGLEQQYLSLHFMNRGGNTIFLEDNPEKLGNSHTAKIFRVEYNTRAANAFRLLKYARMNQVCKPNQGQLRLRYSPCKLALTNLPLEIYDTLWDVILVDGPSGHTPEAPGRMSAIYTASMLARGTEKSTEVIVHDVDQMIEKWFSWEYLCDENLTSSKGKIWNFTITTKSRNSTRFCTTGK